MRILIVAPLYPPATGGSATYFKILTDFLTHQDEVEEVTVLTARMRGEPEVLEEGKLRVLRTLPQLPKASSRIGWIMGEGLRFPVSYFKTIEAIKAYSPDVVHVHKTRSYGGAVLAARSRKVPVIGDVRDLHDLDIYKKCTMFIACGKAAAEKLKSQGIPEKRIELHPVPFDLRPKVDESAYKELRQGVLENNSYILFIGDINEMKGVPELLEAHRSFRKNRKDVDLVLVGKEGIPKETLGGLDGVHILGPLPHAQVIGLLKNAEVLILPSRFEVFPRVCIEGLIMGRKVIFPNVVPEFKETVLDFVLSEISAEAIEHMLIKVLTSDDRPRYPLERHDASRVCKMVLRLYTQLIS